MFRRSRRKAEPAGTGSPVWHPPVDAGGPHAGAAEPETGGAYEEPAAPTPESFFAPDDELLLVPAVIDAGFTAEHLIAPSAAPGSAPRRPEPRRSGPRAGPSVPGSRAVPESIARPPERAPAASAAYRSGDGPDASGAGAGSGGVGRSASA